MAVEIFQTIYTYYSQGITSVINTTSSNISANLLAPVKTALIIYISLYGIANMLGQIRDLMSDIIRQVLRTALIFTLATNSNDYAMWVTNTFITALPQFTQTVTSAPAANSSTVDAFVNFVTVQAEMLSQDAGTFDFSTQIEAAILLVAGYLVGVIAAFLQLVAQVPLALLIAVGPIFIALALFEVTRKFFFGWLTGVVLFTIISLFLNVLLAIVMNSAQQVSQLVGGDPSIAFFVLLATTGIAGVLLTIVPAMAAIIAGGGAGIVPSVFRGGGLGGGGGQSGGPGSRAGGSVSNA